MKQTLEEFKESLKLLNIEIESRFAEVNEEEELYPIFDGPMSPEDYYNSPRKILWLLKEPYGKDNSWKNNSYESWYKNPEFKLDNPTWRMVANTSHCILQNILSHHASFPKDIFAALGKIAWINIQKVPRHDSSYSDTAEIEAAYNNGKDIISKQIDLFQPDIIICGGTFEIVCGLFDCSHKGTIGNCDYYQDNDKIILEAYHPAYWKVRGTYAKEIVLAGEVLTGKSRLTNLELFKTQLLQVGKELNTIVEYSNVNKFGIEESSAIFLRNQSEKFAIGIGFDSCLKEFYYGINIIGSLQPLENEKKALVKKYGVAEGATEKWPWCRYFETPYKDWDDEAFEGVVSKKLMQKIKTILKGMMEVLEGA